MPIIILIILVILLMAIMMMILIIIIYTHNNNPQRGRADQRGPPRLRPGAGQQSRQIMYIMCVYIYIYIHTCI